MMLFRSVFKSTFAKMLSRFETDYQQTYRINRYSGLIILALLTLVGTGVVLNLPVQQVHDSTGMVVQSELEKHIHFPVSALHVPKILPGIEVSFNDNQGRPFTIPIQNTHFDAVRQTLSAQVICEKCQLRLGQSVALHIVIAKQSAWDMFVSTFNSTHLAEDE